jgi:RNA polymerase sigma-70 factor (ECF subfamily)
MEAVQAHPPNSDAGVADGVPATTDFVDCYRMHYRRLLRALQLSGADAATAEDITQEAFARALVHWRRIRKGANPPGYVYTTGFRLLARARRRPGPAPPAAPTPPPPTESAALTALAVEATLASMPPRRRACAVMCLVVGIPVPDAAAALGIAAGTVRKHLEEARRDLQAACEPPG